MYYYSKIGNYYDCDDANSHDNDDEIYDDSDYDDIIIVQIWWMIMK